MTREIQLIPAHQINQIKWNTCIDQSENGRIYSNTNYLDHLADNWSGIIIDDYAAVMPIPWKKKWGIRYAYVPPFTQQLGVSGHIDFFTAQKSLEKMKQDFRYGDFAFNSSNHFIPELFSDQRKRKNRIINLNQPYDTLSAEFSGDAQRNIRQALKHSLHWQDGNTEEIIERFREQMKYVGAPQKESMERFKKICQTFQLTRQVICKCVTDKENQLLAAIVALKDNRRIYNLLNLTTPEGRKKSGNYFLFSQLLQEWANQPLWLDLEGSELPGVQSFYTLWGGEWETYFWVHHNRLPLPLRWIKR